MAVALSDLLPSSQPAFAIVGNPHGDPVLWLRGEHDASTVPELWATLKRAMALHHDDVVVDLSEVEFMAVATVRALRRAEEVLRLNERALVLRAPSTAARRILGLCGPPDSFADHAPAAALRSWVPVPATPPAGTHYKIA